MQRIAVERSDERHHATNLGTALTRYNACRHGILAKALILPWEREDEYTEVLSALISEHKPQGPTEEHLVEEIAGVFWRKRRLRLAEAAALKRGLCGTFGTYSNTAKAAIAHFGAFDCNESVAHSVRTTEADAEAWLADMKEEEADILELLQLLEECGDAAFDDALARLREDTKDWWEDLAQRSISELEDGEQPYTYDAAGLRRFLEERVVEWFRERQLEIANRDHIRNQAFGEALDIGATERLARYEVHLDRKLEKTLALLIKLQEIRQTVNSSDA